MTDYDVIVVGAGHAGCEAALACARLNRKTLLLTMNNDCIAYMACNPAIGGTSKGHLVREIDALGGEMGICADATRIQMKMLNTAKGPAVHSLRAQMDKFNYSRRMKYTLENTDNLHLRQAEAVELIVKNNKACGIKTYLGATINAKTVILATGVYLKGRIYIGEYSYESGPAGLFHATGLSDSLVLHGFKLRRFKTGTPARIDKRSIDFSKFETEYGDNNPQNFSFVSTEISKHNVPCFLGYTNAKTHEIIKENLHRSPLYSGNIEGIGPRYCPSIEDKVVKFADKERHQFFLEPEGLLTNEIYVQGMSSSLPEDVQIALYRSIVGLENAVFTRTAYAIEYDCIDSRVLKLSLESKDIAGLFFAGQINGTSGYEEAAAQGLISGINAHLHIKNEPPLIINRAQGYAGVLIDDLVTKGTNEPYRMMTARAEYRLLLRQDNADFRLTELARSVGLVSDERYSRYMFKKEKVESALEYLGNTTAKKERINEILKDSHTGVNMGMRLNELLKRPEVKIYDVLSADDYDREVLQEAEAQIKYEGYILKQARQVERFAALEEKTLNPDIDYTSIRGLRIEATQKLSAVRPVNLGQASRISGVSPADISVLLVYLTKK